MIINLKTFDLNLLRVMLAIWETRSISRAADFIGMSQPATSNALARLRQALGDPVFVRTKDGMIPSTAAARVLPDLKKHIEGVYTAISDEGEFSPATSSRTFTLSLSGLGELMFLPGLLAKTLKSAPNIRFHNAPVSRQNLAGALRTNQVDLAIGLIELGDADIVSEDLFEERYVLVAGAGMQEPPSCIDELHCHQFVLSAPGTSYGDDIERLVRQLGLEGNIATRLAHISAIAPILFEFPLLSFLPEQFASHLSKTGNVRVLPIDIEQDAILVRMFWHKKNNDDPSHQWLSECVRSLFASGN
jgi:DNA-binding transcriptional LysR family regulator